MEKIAIVEDEFGIRESLVDIFELSGYEVKSAANGKEGFKLILEENPDIVLCDVNMPEMNGFELLGAINQRMRNEQVPIFLFLTAKVELSDISYGLSLGADDYIMKPFDPVKLLDSVRMRLDKRKNLLESISRNTENPNEKNELPKSYDIQFNKLAIPSEDGLELIPFSDILQCEADRAYCNFYTKNGSKHLVSKSMSEFEEILLKHGFVKVHKSHIVNIEHASKYLKGKSGQLLMDDGSIIPVSIRKKEELLAHLRS